MKTERDSIAVVDAIYEALDPEGNNVSVCRLCSRFTGERCRNIGICQEEELSRGLDSRHAVVFEPEQDCLRRKEAPEKNGQTAGK